jgi:myosin protein heavy chain
LNASETQRSRDDLASRLKDLERKVKTIEGELSQTQEELTNAERARRSAEGERDELQDELTSANSKS